MLTLSIILKDCFNVEQRESGIFHTNHSSKLYTSLFSDPELIYSSHKTRLYRLKLRGKYFIAKTYVGLNGENHDILSKEFEIVSGCSHPNIIHVFTLEEETPVGEALIMEYIEGRNLLNFLAENPSKKDKERLIDQLLGTVNYLHSKGIIHNDLKPENLMVCYSDNSLRLIDFDLADNPTHYLLKNRGCTMEFAAPELINNHFSDKRSDIYSIGRLIKLICGKKYGKMVEKCLAVNPENRFQDIAALNFRWNTRESRKFIPFIATGCFLIIGIVLLFYNINPKHERQTDRQFTLVCEPIIENEIQGKNEFQQDPNLKEAEIPIAANRNEEFTIQRSSQNIDSTIGNNRDEATGRNVSNQLFNEINEFNTSLFDKTIREIHLNRFQEFAPLIIQKFQKNIISNYDSYINKMKDEGLQQELRQHQMVFLSDKGVLLYNEIQKLPSLFSLREEMPEEEFESYLKLLSKSSTIY